MDGRGRGKDKIIGIDLGTTYSSVGVWMHDRVEIIVNEYGSRTTPSMVAFTPNERLVGDAAKFQISTNPVNTVFDAKRLIGRRFTDPTVQADIKLWPFTVVGGDNDKPMIEVSYKGEKKLVAAEEISSMVLMRMKRIAQYYLNRDVKNAVITVPAYFSDSQKRATKDAGRIAGLNVMAIINEPTAAAITYGYGFGETCSQKRVVIFDIGGGTFDVSVVCVSKDKIEVKTVAGDMHLGGEDFDNRMLNYCVQHFNRKYKSLDISKCSRALRRLRSECERAKRSLSSAMETVIDIDYLYEGKDFHLKIGRAKFEDVNADLFEKCMQIVNKCLEDAQISKQDIDEIVLVGGSSRIPKLQELLSQFFEDKIEVCKTLNPDEAVAYGAAVRTAVINNELLHLVLLDVTPLSLGVETKNGVMAVIIPRNSPIPSRISDTVTTARDNQMLVHISVYEGESPLTAHNNFLGNFFLRGIPAARRMVPVINVVFQVDRDGILTVSAQDEGSGVSNGITIINEGGRLSKEEIDRMVRDAYKFRMEDEEAKKRRVARHSLECYTHNMKSRASEAENKGTLHADVARNIIETINAAQQWLDDNESSPTIDELHHKFNDLESKFRFITPTARYILVGRGSLGTVFFKNFRFIILVVSLSAV